MSRKKKENLTPKLMKQFGCEAKDVYFAILISQGIPDTEAYVAIFQPEILGTSVATLKNRHLRANPQINSLITYLSNEKIETDIKESISKEDVKELVDKYKDKDFIIAELINSLKGLKGKDRADILNKIADLQQMKKEETKSEEERVHYYLPLQVCKDCKNKNKII